MTVLHRNKAGNSQRGVALILALLVLLIVGAVGVGMVFMANTETNISSNFRDEQTAFFSSRAGLEEVRDRLRSVSPNTLNGNLPVGLPGTTNGILYVTNPAAGEVVAPWNTAGSNYPDTEICKEVSCTGGVPGGTPWYSTPQSASASYAANPQLNWKWVRLMPRMNAPFAGSTTASVDGSTNGNRVCWNGTNEVVVAAGLTCQQANATYRPVYELTSLAVTNSNSRRMTQYEVTSDAFPPPPGAMVFDGPNPIYGAPNSNAFHVDGNDANLGPNNGAGCGAPSNEPALGAYDNPSASTLTNNNTVQQRQNNYTGTGGTPSVQNINPALGSLATVDGLQRLVNAVTAAADSANIYTGPVSSLTNPGTPSAPVINVVNGNLTLGGGFSGTGILLVTGTLTVNGNPSYNGLILVIGKGIVQKNGGGNGTLNGSILVANMFDSSGNPIPLGANNPPGAPTVNWNGGGNATIQYDTCWINSIMQSFPYRVVGQRELMY